MSRKLARLEDRIHAVRNRVRVGNVIVVEDIDVKKMARMIEGKLEQGEALDEAVVSTVQFYERRHPVSIKTEGMDALVESVRAWASESARADDVESDDVLAARRAQVTARVREIFRGHFGDVPEDTEVDDPVFFLEEVAEEFGVPTPQWSDIAEIVEFILPRWKG